MLIHASIGCIGNDTISEGKRTRQNPGDEHITVAVDDNGINPKDFNRKSWQPVAKMVDAIFNIFLGNVIKFESTDSPTEDNGGADSSATKSQSKIQNEMLKQLKEKTIIAAAMLGNSDDTVKHRAKSNSRDD